MKQGIEIATTDVLGKKIEPKLVVGTYNGYGSGEIFDANAVSDLVDARISEIVNLAPEAFDTLGEIAEILNVKQDYISDLEQIRNGAYLGATSYQRPTEGIPYEDLSEGVQVLLDKANTAIQNHQDVSNKVNISDLSAVAFSGSYLDLSYLPTIPTRVSQLANDAGYLTQHQDISYKANRSELFSRDYNDLLNKPTIPVVPTNISAFNNDVGYLTQHQDISGLQQLIPDLETIRSGAALGATSIQEHQSLSDYLLKAAISDWAKQSTKPAYNLDEVTDGSTRKLSNYYTKEQTESLIPTNVSAFTNDVPYLTAHQSISHLLPISGAFVDIEYKSKKFYKTKYNSSNNQVESEIVSASTLVDDGGGVKQANVSSSTPTLSWGATSKIGSVGSVDFSVKMPANPNTNTAGLYVIDKANKKVSTVESPAQFIQFTGGENKFSIKDHNNQSFDVSITPYIENCVTGSSLTNNTVILGGGDSTISSSGKQIQTSISNSNSYIPTSKAVVSYVTSQLASVLTYKGTIGTSDATVTELPATHKVGDVYVVSTAGTFAGKACEVGDYIICRIAGTVANDSHWDVVSGENQVENKQASLASAGSSATIAAVDGTNITITTPSTWTGLTKTGTITKVGNTTSGIVTVSSGENTATYNGFCTVGTVGGIDLRFKMPEYPNTWRGIQDNLTSSTNTTESLSAKQGYLLANGSARDNTKLPLKGGTLKHNVHQILNIYTSAEDDGNGLWAGIKFGKTANSVDTGYGGIEMNAVNGSLYRYTSGYSHYKMWDENNDGSGSGLDADLLDGQHASYFATASSLTSANTNITTLQGYFINGVAKTANQLPAAYAYDGGKGHTNPYHLVAETTVTSTNARNITAMFLVDGHETSNRGILVVNGRVDSGKSTIRTTSTYAKWIVKDSSVDVNKYILTAKATSNTFTLRLYYKVLETWQHSRFRILDQGQWSDPSNIWTFHNTSSDTAGDYIMAEIPQDETQFVSVDATYSATAAQLSTSRTIWGQSFNGTANVSGAITGATTISASSDVSVGGTLDVTGAITATGGVISSGNLTALDLYTSDSTKSVSQRLKMFEKVMFNGYDYVDLGLPSGNLWATCNIGAENPEDAGLYFAWGAEAGYAAGSGHNFNVITSQYKNTARYNMKGCWTVPTRSDFQELENNCTKSWVTISGVSGYKFTSTNGNSIFFPAAGYYEGTTLTNNGSRGRYWTSEIGSSPYSYGFQFISGTTYHNYVYTRSSGFNIRAVTNSNVLSSMLDTISDLDERVSRLEQ